MFRKRVFVCVCCDKMNNERRKRRCRQNSLSVRPLYPPQSDTMTTAFFFTFGTTPFLASPSVFLATSFYLVFTSFNAPPEPWPTTLYSKGRMKKLAKKVGEIGGNEIASLLSIWKTRGGCFGLDMTMEAKKK
mmetsp:Transcript_3717/g.5438  ORF Transcript_3717/g.5438 Transcript_3717/m.5438 type:complete len:132 (-) Transcript_3717:509-904(-)